MAFDDSGGVERLIDYDGRPFPGEHPIAVLAAVYVRDSALSEFNAEWCALRERIRHELSCDWLPPIHLRLMWGKDVRRKVRGRQNPYCEASFAQIQEWLREAWRILQGYIAKRDAGFFFRSIDRAEHAEQDRAYLESPLYTRDMHALKRRSRRVHRAYHQAIFSPLLRLMREALPLANELMRTQRDRASLDVLVDAFADSRGVDMLLAVDTIRQLESLEHVSSVDRVENGDEEAIVQAADLAGYSVFRTEMIRRGVVKQDNPFMAIVGNRNGQTITVADVAHRVNRAGRVRNVASSLTIHYAVARSHVAAVDAVFAEECLVSVEEFKARVEAAHAKGEVGVSPLKEHVFEDFNVEGPELASGAP